MEETIAVVRTPAPSGVSPEDKRELSQVLGMALILIGLSSYLSYEAGLRGHHYGLTLAAFSFLIMGYCLFGAKLPVRAAAAYLQGKPTRLFQAVPVLLIPYLLVTLSGQEFQSRGLPFLAAYLLLPTVMIALGRASPKGRVWPDFLAAVVIWLPFDFRWMNSMWPGRFAPASSTLLAMNLSLLLFICFRRLDNVGYDFHLDWTKMKQALLHFLGFAPIAVPIGLATGFLAWSPDVSSPGGILTRAFLIFFLTALPEELLFRGLLQNSLVNLLGDKKRALWLASIIFGAAHLNNLPFPQNVVYMLLATVAGFFYGRAYLVTGTLMAGALTHMLVDLVWVELFRS